VRGVVRVWARSDVWSQQDPFPHTMQLCRMMATAAYVVAPHHLYRPAHARSSHSRVSCRPAWRLSISLLSGAVWAHKALTAHGRGAAALLLLHQPFWWPLEEPCLATVSHVQAPTTQRSCCKSSQAQLSSGLKPAGGAADQAIVCPVAASPHRASPEAVWLCRLC
jgi:hypothetical protein